LRSASIILRTMSRTSSSARSFSRSSIDLLSVLVDVMLFECSIIYYTHIQLNRGSRCSISLKNKFWNTLTEVMGVKIKKIAIIAIFLSVNNLMADLVSRNWNTIYSSLMVMFSKLHELGLEPEINPNHIQNSRYLQHNPSKPASRSG
jgi:hypothetical protein